MTTSNYDLRPLLKGTYYPYGSQYYRAPSPPPEDWEDDLSRMADLGFNTVKFWVQWRWNHPEENRFYFDDIDRLMDLSEKYGLKVMLNTIVDVAPAWIYSKYSDASMLTLDGRRIGPQTQSHRQIGGLGVCLNHDGVMNHMFEFLKATFERYSEHPALEIWNVASEPELTQSMSEMRLYADDASKMGDMLCFCDHCILAFRRWLEKKYGTVEQLNAVWNRNYTSFDEAEVPKTRNTFNDVIDWRMFFVDVLGENVRRRFEIAREADRGRHPLMCHHVFIQGFPVISTANDPWNVGKLGDLHGFTQMDDAMMHDVLRSCARGKPVLSAEMLMLMGYTLNLHKRIDANDIKRHVFTGVAANLKGFVFWQYRPEMLGREAPAWGLSHLDGSTTPWLESFAEVGRALSDRQEFFHGATNRFPADVAILYS
ncbi:MAG: beta-galactosidase, partial [Rhodothermia bacterium]|nr:beta-galactosidase [Rhodothermia bacterium]